MMMMRVVLVNFFYSLIIGSVVVFFVFACGFTTRIETCKEAVGLALVQAVQKPGWAYDGYRAQRGAISLWLANDAFGLGVAVGGEALAEDGDLSRGCRVAIWHYAKPLIVDPWIREQKAILLRAVQ